MASVTLSRYEAENKLLPNCCMSCGAPATTHRTKQFSWNPPWVFLLLFAGLLPLLIVALITTKKMKVHVPLCDEHKGHWSKRTAWTLAGFGILVLLGIGAIAGGAFDAKSPLFGVACAGLVVSMIVWIFVAAILQHTSIHPREITDRSITLVKVSQEFVHALEAHHDEEPEHMAFAKGSSGGSAFPIVALVVLGSFGVIIMLAAISVLGEKSNKNNPPGGFNNALFNVNMTPVIDDVNHFTLNYPGPGWSMQTRAQVMLENPLGRAGAQHNDGRSGVVLIEDEDEPFPIAGREDELGKIVMGGSMLTNKTMVSSRAMDFRGRPAVRVQFTGNSLDGKRVRTDTTVFTYQGKIFQILVVGFAATTPENGSAFQPFLDAFVLTPAKDGDGKDKDGIAKDRKVPKKKG